MTRICDDLSRPEDSAERQRRRKILEEIKKCGGCGLCIHRDANGVAWGRFPCKVEGRTFPRCVEDDYLPAFELDEGRLNIKLEEAR